MICQVCAQMATIDTNSNTNASTNRIKKLILFGTGSIGVLPNRETIEESRNKIKTIGIEKTRENIGKTWFVDYSQKERQWQSHQGYQLCLEEGRKGVKQHFKLLLQVFQVLMHGILGMLNGQEHLHLIASQTMILWASKDRTYDYKQQEILHQGIKNSKLVMIDD